MIHDTWVQRLSDAELIARAAQARDDAHNAPKAMENGSRAWADRSRDWMELATEIKRRGL